MGLTFRRETETGTGTGWVVPSADGTISPAGNGTVSVPPGTAVPQTARKPGTYPIGIATGLLMLLGVGLLIVSMAAQYQYLLPARHGEKVPALILAGAVDALMITFSLLAFGMSRAGKPARIERSLIMVCGLTSAGMNLAEADMGSLRSVAAYVVAPIALAITIDRLIAVVYRWVNVRPQRSAWHTCGRVTLYAVRFTMSPVPTAVGVRRMVLAAAPIPDSRSQAARRDKPRETRPSVPVPSQVMALSQPPADETTQDGDDGTVPIRSQSDAIRAALETFGGDVGQVVTHLKSHGYPKIVPQRVYTVIARDEASGRMRPVPADETGTGDEATG